jgi:hypothetical protein
VHTEIPSTLTLAYNVLTKMRISSLAYRIVSVNRRVTFITSEVLTSRHDCVSNIFAYKLHAPMQLAGCKVTTVQTHGFLREHFCTKKSHRLYWDHRCTCKLCVKKGPATVKSLCVYKLYDRICSTLKDSFM